MRRVRPLSSALVAWTLCALCALALAAEDPPPAPAPGDPPGPPAPAVPAPPIPAPAIPAPGAAPDGDEDAQDPEEPESEAEEPQEYEPPLYNLDALWPAETDLPAGWTLVQGPDGPPASSLLKPVRALLALQGTQGPPDTLDLRALSLSGPRGARADILMLASELDPSTWRARLDRGAAEQGWVVSELGDPSRLLIVRASESVRQSLHRSVRVQVVQGLCDLCHRAMRSAAQDGEPMRFWLAREYLQAAANMEPDAGGVRMLEGQVSMVLRNSERAVELFRAALAEDLAIRPRPALAVLAAGLLGHELLAKGDGPHLEEARTVLERAVAWEQSEDDLEQRFNNRYNLACVKARLGDAEQALIDLESSLVFARTHLQRIYIYAWRYARYRDPDLARVRSDARFSALMDRVAPPR